jgi:molybdopterin synthase sulfur carrier subunit
MSVVTIQLPRVLADLIACERRVVVEGTTVAEALEDLVRRHPEFRFHLFDDTGALRRHVLCFCNEVNTRTRSDLDRVLVDGDTLALVNSVAGG